MGEKYVQEARLARRMRFFVFVLSDALRFCASFFFGARVSPHLPHLSHVEGFFFVLRVTDLQACACCVILICAFRVLWSQVCSFFFFQILWHSWLSVGT